MSMKPNNTSPSIKDKIINYNLALNIGAEVPLFYDPWYDYDIKAVSVVISTISQAAAAPFTLGFGKYTDLNGNLISANDVFFLPAASCLDSNKQSFSTQALALGTSHVIALPPDPHGLGLHILPAGAVLVVMGGGASNTGKGFLCIKLRPKQKDRGDSSKRPWGASDNSFATYLK